MDYLQPHFYHFSEDSIHLVQSVLEFYKNRKLPLNLIDVGSGCGVIGIELAQRFAEIDLTLLEKQSEFKKSLEANVKNFLQRDVNILNHSIQDYSPSQKFELVVSNPPYFAKGNGRKSESIEKQTCRTFTDESLESWIEFCRFCLTENGTGFILMRESHISYASVVEKYSLELLKKFAKVNVLKFAHK